MGSIIPRRALLDRFHYAVYYTLGVPDRGLIKYSEGTVHVLVNGRFAFRDGKPTTPLAGRPILRGGRVLEPR